jgi:hypothetical protein
MKKNFLLAILIPFVIFTMAHAYVNADVCYDKGFNDSEGFDRIKEIKCTRYDRSISALFAGILSPVYWTIIALEENK